VTDPKDLRAHAARLRVLAARARKNGDAKYADWLIDKAAEHLDQAQTLENSPMGSEPTARGSLPSKIGPRPVG